ncbi:MAG: hypothetical protein Q7J69_06070 [Candidatus Omnitrophota bacterium]|nr:hypothetical protein [Candidatus Omnitrophota bacterium]
MTERLYPKLRHSPLIRAMEERYSRAEVEPIFKYALMTRLFRQVFMRKWMENFGKGAALIPAFQPSTFRYYLASLARVFLSILIRPDYGPIQFKYLYSIESAFQAKRDGSRRFDFLLDGVELTQQNTLFVVGHGVDGDWVEEEMEQGYEFTRWNDYVGVKDLRAALHLNWLGLKHWTAPAWIHEAFTSGLWTQIRNGTLIGSMKPGSRFIYTNQYGLTPRWRNVLLRRQGASSWYFTHSSGGGFERGDTSKELFGNGKDFGGLIRLWMYDNPDHFVTVGKEQIDYYKKHRQAVSTYHAVGNIWSEHILEMAK